MKVDRFFGIALIGAAVGLLVASYIVPDDPVNELRIEETTQKVAPILGEPVDQAVVDRWIIEATDRARRRTSEKLSNVGTGCIVAAIAVMCLGGVVRHYRNEPCPSA